MKDQSTFNSKQYTIIQECFVALIKDAVLIIWID